MACDAKIMLLGWFGRRMGGTNGGPLSSAIQQVLGGSFNDTKYRDHALCHSISNLMLYTHAGGGFLQKCLIRN